MKQVIYNSSFWNAVDSARKELSGSYHYDHETEIEYNFPAKDVKKYSNAYEYSYACLNSLINLAESIDEINLIRIQIQHSQDFCKQTPEYSTDFILNFSYKNWIIRINLIAEQVIKMVIHVYQLKLSKKDIFNQIFEHSKVKNNQTLYLALLDLVDFLHEKILSNVTFGSLKKARNEILHNSDFHHATISGLSMKLIEYKMGISDIEDMEDLYLEEGMASEKIKNEISIFTDRFSNKCLSLFKILADDFSSHFTILMK